MSTICKESSTEKVDQLRHSVKKYKRDDGEEEHPPNEEMDMGQPSTPIWQRGSFVTTIQRKVSALPIYTGEGEEDMMDDLGMEDILLQQDTMEDGELCPIVVCKVCSQNDDAVSELEMLK